MSHRPQAKRRRIELSLKTKIDLIRAAESVPKLNQNQLTENFGIGTSTVSDILKKKKEEYCGEYEKNAISGKMRCKTACQYDELNELTWRWFLHVCCLCVVFLIYSLIYIKLLLWKFYYVTTRTASGTLRTVYIFQGVNEIGRDVPNVSDVIEITLMCYEFLKKITKVNLLKTGSCRNRTYSKVPW